MDRVVSLSTVALIRYALTDYL